MEQNDNFKNTVSSIEEYFKTEKQLLKLYVIEKTSIASSSVVSSFIIISIFTMMFLFLNLAVAYVISEYCGKISYGFLSVGIFYFLIGLVLFIKRNSWLKTPFTNSLIKKMLGHE
jgi:hypothetical protein